MAAPRHTGTGTGTDADPAAPRRALAGGGIRLSPRHEAAALVVLAGLTASGVLWLVFHYLVPPANEFTSHPAEAWSLRVHGGLAMLSLLLVGTLLTRHVPLAWQRRLNRGSGGAMLALLLGLGVTGWLLYYAGSPALRDVTSWLHAGLGVALPFLLVWHMRRGGRWRR